MDVVVKELRQSVASSNLCASLAGEIEVAENLIEAFDAVDEPGKTLGLEMERRVREI